jgi:hypothetical protein
MHELTDAELTALYRPSAAAFQRCCRCGHRWWDHTYDEPGCGYCDCSQFIERTRARRPPDSYGEEQ